MTNRTVVVSEDNVEVVDACSVLMFGAAGTVDTSIALPAGPSGINGHRAVVVTPDGTLAHAEPSDADSFIGISMNAALPGDQVRVAVRDSIAEPAWAWTPGGPVFFTAGGALTQSLPASGSVATVGVALTPTSLLISRTTPIFLGA